MKLFLSAIILFIISWQLSAQNVGINTNMPGADLHVNGDIKISDGTQGDGKVLTSNAAGLATWQLPKASFTLGSDASVSSNSYVGLGSSGTSFIRNSIVMPFNGTLAVLVFSVRVISNTTVSCEIYKASNGAPPTATGIIATVTVGTSYAVATGNVPMNQGDLLSVKISSGLIDGISATIVYQ